jgi:cobalt-zinc-cadmium efflux system protein
VPSPNSHAASAYDRQRLIAVLIVIALYFVVELTAGWLTNSLALLSDAIHMLTDSKTFGYLRAEILGALVNGLFLWLLVAFIWIEAVRRLRTPEHVKGLGVMAVACVGIAVNAFAAWMTTERAGGRGMAVRAVFVHVLSDLIGSVGVLIAGALVYFTGFWEADPAVSILIGGLVLFSSWGLIRDGVDILMESVPAHIDVDQLREDLLAVEGAEELHDLHIWCLTSREYALAAHCVVTADADQDRVLSDMSRVLQTKFAIHHMTVQLERDSRREHEPDHF